MVWFPRETVNVQVRYECSDDICPTVVSSSEDKVERGLPFKWSEIKTDAELFYDRTDINLISTLADFSIPIFVVLAASYMKRRKLG